MCQSELCRIFMCNPDRWLVVPGALPGNPECTSTGLPGCFNLNIKAAMEASAAVMIVPSEPVFVKGDRGSSPLRDTILFE